MVPTRRCSPLGTSTLYRRVGADTLVLGADTSVLPPRYQHVRTDTPVVADCGLRIAIRHQRVHSPYLTMSARYYLERSSVRDRRPPWKSLGMCRCVTNKGESGLGKASPWQSKGQGRQSVRNSSGSVVGCPLNEREKAWSKEVHHRVSSLSGVPPQSPTQEHEPARCHATASWLPSKDPLTKDSPPLPPLPSALLKGRDPTLP